MPIEFTDRQHTILLALDQDKFAKLRTLAEMVGIPVPTIYAELKRIRLLVDAKSRPGIVQAARAAGWQVRPPDEPEETAEQQLERLIGDSVLPGRMRSLRIKARMIHHANGNLQQAIELMREASMTPAQEQKLLDNFHAQACRLQQALSGFILAIGEQRAAK